MSYRSANALRCHITLGCAAGQQIESPRVILSDPDSNQEVEESLSDEIAPSLLLLAMTRLKRR